MTLFDIHTHIVPYIDDGARNEEAALKLLETSYKSGVRKIILTPHYNEELGFTADIREYIKKMQNFADKIADDFRLYTGSEILYSSNTVSLLQSHSVSTLADSNYILVEFSYTISKEDLFFATNELLLSGYWPIIAHAERYDCLYDKGVPEYLTDSGAYLQINSQTIISSKYKEARLIKKLFKKNLVSFIGSDCHSIHRRPPNLGTAAQIIETKYGKNTAERILFNNPNCILNNQRI